MLGTNRMKIKKPESFDSGFPCSGDRTILHFISDGPLGGALLRKAQTAARSSFLHSYSFLKVNFQHF